MSAPATPRSKLRASVARGRLGLGTRAKAVVARTSCARTLTSSRARATARMTSIISHRRVRRQCPDVSSVCPRPLLLRGMCFQRKLIAKSQSYNLRLSVLLVLPRSPWPNKAHLSLSGLEFATVGNSYRTWSKPKRGRAFKEPNLLQPGPCDHYRFTGYWIVHVTST